VGSDSPLSDHWEKIAGDWIAWARTSEHDGFKGGTWPTLRLILPPPTGWTIDLGCGEGRLGRELIELGYQVVGIEQSPTLVAAAIDGDPSLPVIRSDAAALPLADGTVDLVVACMSLIDMDDFTTAVAESARVLVPGGQMCVALVHPFASAQDVPVMGTANLALHEPYMQARRYDVFVERDGLKMSFASMHRPLQDYMAAWRDVGLAITDVREFGDQVIPWLMAVETVKL
jgi:SAM-dependent methyltransferase